MMIEITNQYITNNRIDKKALALLGADVVEIEDDKITFKTDVDFGYFKSLASVTGITFNGDVEFFECNNLFFVYDITFNGNVKFESCKSLVSVSGATFKKGFKAYKCNNLKQ